MPLIFITAYSGLVDRARLQPGSTVLVHGGADGVGHMAVQIAQAMGAQVFATANPGDQECVAQWGATPIDYTAQSVEQYVKQHTAGVGFDLVFDTVGGATLDSSFAAVKHYGHVVSALGWGTHALAPLSFREATYSGIFMTGKNRAHHGDMLREAARLVEAGKLRPLVDPTHYDLSTAEAAYASVTGRQRPGKVLVTVG
ncbi:zinc-binding dehydrogenase [Marinobacter sp. C2H3]|uniref:zinc-binding dehydrogenase n=1 Tax=Marinobacter sp. C2H3 TaxID=3119003 RepID=UPI00300F254C